MRQRFLLAAHLIPNQALAFLGNEVPVRALGIIKFKGGHLTLFLVECIEKVFSG